MRAGVQGRHSVWRARSTTPPPRKQFGVLLAAVCACCAGCIQPPMQALPIQPRARVQLAMWVAGTLPGVVVPSGQGEQVAPTPPGEKKSKSQ